jgi:hypothetical protein
MSTSERDTHFKGFARLVFADLSQHTKEHWSLMQADYIKFAKQQEQLVAQRAYDLVFYLLKNSDALALDMGGYRDKPDDLTVYEHIKMLPDIPEFPTTSPADVFWEEEILATDLSEYDAGEEYDSEYDEGKP